jgi:hypothetical protein
MMSWRACKETIKYNVRHTVSPFLTQFLDESYKHYGLTWENRPTHGNAKWEPYSVMAWHNLKLIYHYRKNNIYSYGIGFATPEDWDAALIKMEKAFVFAIKDDEWDPTTPIESRLEAIKEFEEGMLLFATNFRSLWI